MKLFVLLFLIGFSSVYIHAQDESLGPITRKNLGDRPIKKLVRSGNPLDSSFVYISDTLKLPVFDEFSRSKFQEYTTDPADPNVTEQLWHKLTDLGNVPLAPTASYTSQITKKYTIEADGDTSAVVELTPISIKSSDLVTYPFTYFTVNAYPPYNIIDSVGNANGPDTVAVMSPNFIQDSVLIFTAQLKDTNAIWLDKRAYHNYTQAINPWSLGVASFDGLDEFGYPYQIETNSKGIADYLTSKPIDLSSQLIKDSLYFSFLVQRGGFCEPPENQDSIILDFYDPSTNKWERVWSLSGGGTNLSTFKVVHLKFKNPKYYVKGFKFRFKNYGHLSGALDHFHLDYVNFRKKSGYQDTVFKDFAFVYPMGSLVEDYHQVPWDHWKNHPTRMNSETRVVVRSGSTILENNQNGTANVFFNGVKETVMPFNLIGQKLSNGINYAPRSFNYSQHDFTTGYKFDPSKSGDDATFDVVGWANAQFPNRPVNDSSFTQQYFGDTYAYDDGSAENAYGVTGAQSRLAFLFNTFEKDSLIGVRMHFVPSVNDVSDKLFLMTVWSNSNGKPGSVLYEDDFFSPRSPKYPKGRDVFVDYYFKDTAKLSVDTSFFIGWRQIDVDRLNLGFDMNTDNQNKIFYSVDGGTSWLNTSFKGSLMMRPIFSTNLNRNLSVDKIDEIVENDWILFPNPGNDVLNIKWNENSDFPGARITDINGRMLYEVAKNEMHVDVSAIPSGIYFIRLENKFGEVKKWIKL